MTYYTICIRENETASWEIDWGTSCGEEAREHAAEMRYVLGKSKFVRVVVTKEDSQQAICDAVNKLNA